MIRVTLSTVDYDPAGYVEIDATADTNDGETRRRVTRHPTLDGGAAFNDFGFAEPDRTILVKWAPSPLVDDAVVRLLQLYSRVIVSTGRAVYLAAPASYRPGTDQSTLQLLVAAKLSA